MSAEKSYAPQWRGRSGRFCPSCQSEVFKRWIRAQSWPRVMEALARCGLSFLDAHAVMEQRRGNCDDVQRATLDSAQSRTH